MDRQARSPTYASSDMCMIRLICHSILLAVQPMALSIVDSWPRWCSGYSSIVDKLHDRHNSVYILTVRSSSIPSVPLCSSCLSFRLLQVPFSLGAGSLGVDILLHLVDGARCYHLISVDGHQYGFFKVNLIFKVQLNNSLDDEIVCLRPDFIFTYDFFFRG